MSLILLRRLSCALAVTLLSCMVSAQQSDVVAGDNKQAEQAKSRPLPPKPIRPKQPTSRPTSQPTSTAPKAPAEAKILHRRERSEWNLVYDNLKYMLPLEGRDMYRSARGMGDSYPFVVLANANERLAGYGYQLTRDNIHQLYSPIKYDLTAFQMMRFLSGGMVIRDAKTFGQIRSNALEVASTMQHWKVKVEKEGMPEFVGVTAAPSEDRTKNIAKQLFVSCAGDGVLSVKEEIWHVPLTGPFRIETKNWVLGPPQSWQTEEGVDDALEQERRAEVERFRMALLEPFVEGRTIEKMSAAVAEDSMWKIRQLAGWPDRVVVGEDGVTVHIYRMPGEMAVVIGAENDDVSISYARFVTGVSEPGTEFQVGATERVLR